MKTMFRLKKPFLFSLTLLMLAYSALSQGNNTTTPSFQETVGSINYIFYAVAAGVAILMITIHAIRWKMTDDPDVVEDSKRGIINVIAGLILIAVAAALVELFF